MIFPTQRWNPLTGGSPALAGRSFTAELPEKPLICISIRKRLKMKQRALIFHIIRKWIVIYKIKFSFIHRDVN